MKGCVAIAVLVLFAAAEAATAHKTRAAPSSAPTSSAIQDTRGTDKNPITIKGSIATSLPPPPTPEQIKGEKEKAKDDHRLTLATVWLAILTLALAVIAFFQLLLFLRQLRLTEEAARDAAIAVNAAKASAEVLPKRERAYVFAEVFIADALSDMHRPYRVNVTVRFTNHGKTPAIILRVRSYPLWSDVPPTTLTPSERENRSVPDGLVIGPGGVFEVPHELQMDDDRRQTLQDVVTRLYVVGLIEYRDVMGVVHQTGFAWHTYPIDDIVRTSISPSPLNFFN